jgi:integrase
MQQQVANSKKLTPVRYAFLYCNSPSTQRQYPKRLKIFFDFAGVEGADLEEQGQAFLDQTRQDPEWANQRIMEYLDYHRQRVFRKEISPSTLKTMLQPIKTFLDAYDDVTDLIKWRRISKAMPKAKRFANDRVPTLEELRKLIEYPDRRIKAVVYTMCSSGIRIGAWEYLKWKHITPIYSPKNDKEVIAAKLVVYAGEPEEHFSYITPEAYHALKDYMDFRTLWGEQVTGDSWLVRNYFKTADVKRKSPRGGNFGKTTKPRQIDQKSLNRLIIRAWQEQGIRDILEHGNGHARRHEFKAAHSMRKYFKTRAEQVMNRLNVEFLMGHSIGLNSNYYRPTEQELLTDYIKAVPSLTINDTNVENLRQQFQDKEKQIEKISARLDSFEQLFKIAMARKIGARPENIKFADDFERVLFEGEEGK